ncbi:caspase domain-containing protein [Bradyrhizobium sp. 2TAF36]|uniref:caspase family protein n=1 Tax=Bradyrhizobium sp. 2TAF36 TaxID=3233016 RepID=UPI003F916079
MQQYSAYLPKYEKSHALVIGIDAYQRVGPLLHAGNDAKAVADALVDKFGFPVNNVRVLLDAEATRENILREYLTWTDSARIGPDDRMVVFFAGHGHTATGRRGEIGYLVPVDGDVSDLSTLVRWDELTRNSDLIAGKHMLFLMDACYGGLALTRSTIPPGGMRFLKDMLQRYSRQVLTAGKPNEVVSDAGGTRPGHSIFTSYLLDGLDGGASVNGVPVTGHGLMAYVYDKVAGDPRSYQTPHFGFLDGDGDFIFDTSILASVEEDGSSNKQPDIDIFIKTPNVVAPGLQNEDAASAILKRLMANPNERIRLNDFINSLLREASTKLSQSHFSANTEITNDEFAARIQRYEDAVHDLTTVVILLARWGDAEQIGLLGQIFSRIADIERSNSGFTVWLKLQWYPLFFLIYAAGMSALAAKRFDVLLAALNATVYSEERISGEAMVPVIFPTVDSLTEIIDDFKRLPGMEKKFVPRSEHIYKKLQPPLEDELLLGRGYDSLFDDFEILLALVYVDMRGVEAGDNNWGPIGRFGWKERGRLAQDLVYSKFVERAKAQKDRWAALDAGFFQGSSERFSEVADAYAKFLSRINMW